MQRHAGCSKRMRAWSEVCMEGWAVLRDPACPSLPLEYNLLRPRPLMLCRTQSSDSTSLSSGLSKGCYSLKYQTAILLVLQAGG